MSQAELTDSMLIKNRHWSSVPSAMVVTGGNGAAVHKVSLQNTLKNMLQVVDRSISVYQLTYFL